VLRSALRSMTLLTIACSQTCARFLQCCCGILNVHPLSEPAAFKATCLNLSLDGLHQHRRLVVQRTPLSRLCRAEQHTTRLLAAMEAQLPSRDEEQDAAQQAVEGEADGMQAANEPIERLQVSKAIRFG
jgi:hypothetical protein